MRKIIAIIYFILITASVMAQSGSNGGVVTGTHHTLSIIDDRIRNNIARDNMGSFYAATFGLDNYDGTAAVPHGKTGTVIKFQITNSLFRWDFTGTQKLYMETGLVSSTGIPITNVNAYSQTDFENLTLSYPHPSEYPTANMRYYGGTGCWASPILTNDNKLIVLNKSGMLFCISQTFITSDEITTAEVYWRINLRHDDGTNGGFCEGDEQFAYEFMATPTLIGQYLYVPGVKYIYKIDIETGTVENAALLQLMTNDYPISPIIPDTQNSSLLYLASRLGKIFTFNTNLSVVNVSNVFTQLLTPPLVDADGRVYIGGGSADAQLFTSGQQIRPTDPIIWDSLISAGQEEIYSMGSPFITTILTDNSKNLYILDDNNIHHYSEQYSLDDLVANDPLYYIHPSEPTPLTPGFRFYGNHSTLYERGDLHKSLIFAVNNSSSIGYYQSTDPFYPDNTTESNILGCNIQADFFANTYKYQEDNPTQSCQAFFVPNNQTWGGITPYLTADDNYNAIFGDECGSMTSYDYAFDCTFFPNCPDTLNHGVLLQTTGFRKFLKTNSHKCDYDITTPVKVIVIDATNPSVVLTPEDIERVYLNSYYQDTEQCDIEDYLNGVQATFTDLLSHPGYTALCECNYPSDPPELISVKLEEVDVNPECSPIIINVRQEVDYYSDGNGNPENNLIWPGSNELYIRRITLHPGTIVNFKGLIHCGEIILYEGAGVNIIDGSLLRVDYINCIPTMIDPRLITFDLTSFTGIPAHSGKLKVLRNMSIQSDGSFISRVKFKCYGTDEEEVDYEFSTMIVQTNCELEYSYLGNIEIPLPVPSAVAADLQNNGILKVNAYLLCRSYIQPSEGECYIASQPETYGVFELRSCYIPNPTNRINGIYQIGRPNNQINNPGYAVFIIKDTPQISLSAQFQTTVDIYGTLSIRGDTELKLINSTHAVLHSNAFLELRGTMSGIARNGSSLYLQSSILTLEPYCHIEGYSPRQSNDEYSPGVPFHGDRIFADTNSNIIGQYNQVNYTMTFDHITISTSNPQIYGPQRWEGIVHNITGNYSAYHSQINFTNCSISGIVQWYIPNHWEITWSNSTFNNCDAGIYFPLSNHPVSQDAQKLTVNGCSFTQCSNGILVDRISDDTDLGRYLFALISNCVFGSQDDWGSANIYGINLYGCQAENSDFYDDLVGTRIMGCEFYQNVVGIQLTDCNSIQIGGWYNSYNHLPNEVPSITFSNDTKCNFYNNSHYGVNFYETVHSLLTNCDFTPLIGIDHSGMGIMATDSWIDVVENSFQLLRGNALVYKNSNKAHSEYGIKMNLLTNNGGAEIIADDLGFTDFNGRNNVIEDDNPTWPVPIEIGRNLPKFEEYYKWDYVILADLEHDPSIPVDVNGNNFIPTFNPESDRFIPEYCFYNSGQGTTTPQDLLSQGIILFNMGNFEEAKFSFKQIIENYPNAPATKLAMQFLYMLEQCTSKDYDTLIAYLDLKITDEYLESYLKKEQIKTKALISLEDYPTAISRLQLIIDNPGSYADSLYAVIDQAYCYLLLASKGEKNLPECCAKTPDYQSFSQFLLGLFKNNESQDNAGEYIVNPLVLDNNYPNPFNPETTICFSIASEAKVKLNIYNIKGQKVKTLVDSKLNPGKYRFVWDGRDNNNKSVSSGVYFTRVETAGKCKTKKMLLLK